jgi:tRNA G10  N-methylase Trm11
MEDIKLRQAKLLKECIIKSIDIYEFKWEYFFKLWFREHGNPLFFLFKKNLSVTNTQYVELFSLLTKYSSNVLEKEKEPKLLFYSTELIKSTFSDLITSLLENYNPNDTSNLDFFALHYIEIFSSSVVVDMFFGSCAVFLPNGIKTDLEKVVFDSGYIQSAGNSVFIRNINKAKKIDFLNSLDTYLESNLSTKKNIPFIIYSHEDYDKYDRESSDLIDRGIEQCKIFVEKMSMGTYRLSAIINEMMDNDKYKEKLIIPKPGNYLKKHNFKKEETLWLISDRSISGGQIKNPGQNRYYICYEQKVLNESPFFFFDENKPAWKSHTTLPHSLTAALLNTSRLFLNNGRICDPFSGAGTTWFEVKRMHLKNSVICSDLSAATKLLTSDNLKFFTMTCDELIYLRMALKKCHPTENLMDQIEIEFEKPENIIDPYTHAKSLIERLKKEQVDEDQEFVLYPHFVSELMELPFLKRIVFYIALRAELRFQGGFKRKSIKFEEAFMQSLKKINSQIKMFIDLKKEVEPNIKLIDSNEQKSYIKSISKYSYRLTPMLAFQQFETLKKDIEFEIFANTDARKLKKASNDLIICDPPYGFNTNENAKELSNLYSEFIDKAIASLRQKGQLIMCLPAESYTGRELPYCTRIDLITRQINYSAHKQGRLAYKPAINLPLSSLSPPYYWESERALRRTILHFCFF